MDVIPSPQNISSGLTWLSGGVNTGAEMKVRGVLGEQVSGVCVWIGPKGLG